MDITDLLKEEHILLDLDVKSIEDCIEKLSEPMVKTGVILDVNRYKETVLNREKEGSTGVGFGIAIPHGKSSAVSKPGLAFAKLTNPVEWNSLDGDPVTEVFLIAVPEEQAGDAHLKILAAISRKLIHEEFRQQLQTANNPSDILKALE